MSETLEIRTSYRDAADVVRELAPWVDDVSIRLAASRAIAGGEWVRFTVFLADGSPFLEGIGRSQGSEPDVAAGYRIHLSLLQFDERNEITFERVVLARDEAESTGTVDIRGMKGALEAPGTSAGTAPPRPLTRPPTAPPPPKAGLMGAKKPTAPPPPPTGRERANAPARPPPMPSKSGAKPASRAEAKRDIEKREIEKRETEKREAEMREAEKRSTEKREAEKRSTEKRAAERRDAERRDAERRDAERRDAERRDAERRDADKRDAERLDAERRDADKRDAERRDADKREPDERDPDSGDRRDTAPSELPAPPEVTAEPAPERRRASSRRRRPPLRVPLAATVQPEGVEMATLDTVVSRPADLAYSPPTEQPLSLEVPASLVARARALAPSVPDSLVDTRSGRLTREEAVLRAALRLGLAALAAMSDDDEL